MSPSRRPSKAESPKVLDRALAVLELFTDRRPEWTVADVAQATELPVSTAYRIVGALESHGLLRSMPGGRLRLGVAAITLGRRATRALDLTVILRPALEQLSDVTGETTTLSIFDARRRMAVCVDRAETSSHLRLSLEIGALLPLHAGAASMALLAFLDESVLAAVLAGPLEAIAPRTITDPDELRAEIAQIREQGWARSYESSIAGAWGVAAPVLHDGLALAVIGMSAPLGRHSEEAEAKAIAETVAIARRATTTGVAKPANMITVAQPSATEAYGPTNRIA